MHSESSVFGDLFVTRRGECFEARDACDRNVVKRDADASRIIQWAINEMPSSGGSVELASGDYPLRQGLSLRGRVTLCGRGPASRLVACAGGNAAIRATGTDGVTLRELSLVALPPHEVPLGLLLKDCGDCRVDGVRVSGFAEAGIALRDNCFLTHVSQCTLAGNAGANLRLENLDRGRAGDYLPNLVTDCRIYGGGTGVECKRAIVVNFVGCVVHQARGAGWRIVSSSNSVCLSGCRTFQTMGDAVVVQDSHELNLTGNVFCWQTGCGLRVRDCNWGVVTGNEFIDSGSYNAGCENFTASGADLPADAPRCAGVELSNARGFVVEGNALFNWGVAPPMSVAIREDTACADNVIAANNINYFQDAGIVAEGARTVQRDNLSVAGPPHNGLSETLQSFQPHRLEAFIRKLDRNGGDAGE